MNERLELRFRMEDSQRASVSEIWILHAQYRDLFFRFCVFTQIDSRRAGRVDAGRVTRVGEERDVSFVRFVEPSRANDLNVVCCSLNPCTRKFGKFRKFHGVGSVAVSRKGAKIAKTQRRLSFAPLPSLRLCGKIRSHIIETG